jgi:hypothetical protein
VTEEPQQKDEHLPETDGPPEEEIKAPFTFKLMIALTVLYLGWRLVQGIMWVIDQIAN